MTLSRAYITTGHVGLEKFQSHSTVGVFICWPSVTEMAKNDILNGLVAIIETTSEEPGTSLLQYTFFILALGRLLASILCSW